MSLVYHFFGTRCMYLYRACASALSDRRPVMELTTWQDSLKDSSVSLSTPEALYCLRWSRHERQGRYKSVCCTAEHDQMQILRTSDHETESSTNGTLNRFLVVFDATSD